jgi:hypothetical protein
MFGEKCLTVQRQNAAQHPAVNNLLPQILTFNFRTPATVELIAQETGAGCQI